MAWLKQAVATGHTTAAKIADDHDLDALRDRHDVKNLTAELDAKAKQKSAVRRPPSRHTRRRLPRSSAARCTERHSSAFSFFCAPPFPSRLSRPMIESFKTFNRSLSLARGVKQERLNRSNG